MFCCCQKDVAKLTSLPLEIREKPAQEIINYAIDQLNGPVSLFRTKLMVVGYEKVGKTSLLEHLFPFATTSPVTFSISSSSFTPVTKEDPHDVTLKLVGKELRATTEKTKDLRKKPSPLGFLSAWEEKGKIRGEHTISNLLPDQHNPSIELKRGKVDRYFVTQYHQQNQRPTHD